MLCSFSWRFAYLFLRIYQVLILLQGSWWTHTWRKCVLINSWCFLLLSALVLFCSALAVPFTHKTVKFELEVTCRDGGVGSILCMFIWWLCCKGFQSCAEDCEVPGAVIENTGALTFKGRMWLRLQWLRQWQWVVLGPCGSQKRVSAQMGDELLSPQSNSWERAALDYIFACWISKCCQVAPQCCLALTLL